MSVYYTSDNFYEDDLPFALNSTDVFSPHIEYSEFLKSVNYIQITGPQPFNTFNSTLIEPNSSESSEQKLIEYIEPKMIEYRPRLIRRHTI